MHTWVLDSIEEGVARVEEDGERVVRIPLWMLPPGVKHGDVMSARCEEWESADLSRVVLEIDRDATREERLRAAEGLEGE